MPSLLSAKGNLEITDNGKLRSIAGFSKLAFTKHFLIKNNLNLTEICGFDSLELAQPFEIIGNQKLHKICGFSKLVSIRSIESPNIGFTIGESEENAQNPQSICGFDRLIAVNGTLHPESGMMSVKFRGSEHNDVPSFLIAIQKQYGCGC